MACHNIVNVCVRVCMHVFVRACVHACECPLACVLRVCACVHVGVAIFKHSVCQCLRVCVFACVRACVTHLIVCVRVCVMRACVRACMRCTSACVLVHLWVVESGISGIVVVCSGGSGLESTCGVCGAGGILASAPLEACVLWQQRKSQQRWIQEN